MATETSSSHPWPPCYYERDGDIFLPNGLARSPWDRQAIAGGPISGLLATGSEDAQLDRDFEMGAKSIMDPDLKAYATNYGPTIRNVFTSSEAAEKAFKAKK